MFKELFNTLRVQKVLWLSAIALIIAGIIHPYAALALLVLVTLDFSSKKKFIELFTLFFITLILSDSRSILFRFAATIKPFYAIFLCLIIFSHKKYFRAKNSVFISFIPFLLIAFYCIGNSHDQSNSLLKTISYALLLFIVPIFVKTLWQSSPQAFLKSCLFSGQIILVGGIVARFLMPSLTTLVGRYRGLFGNPNGLGIFCTVFFILSFCIWFYHRTILNKQIWLIHFSLIILSVFLSASRNTVMSCLLFTFMATTLRNTRTLQITTILVALFLLPTLKIHFVDFIIQNNMNEFFRIDSIEDLESGSGRKVAYEFAWEWINQHYWEGHGFGYTEHLYKINYLKLKAMNHIGNAHNSYLTIWIDTGLWGLVCFIFAWSINFLKASLTSKLALPAFLALAFSATFESWLAASLNPFTIQALILLTLLTQKSFIAKQVHEKDPLPLH